MPEGEMCQMQLSSSNHPNKLGGPVSQNGESVCLEARSSEPLRTSGKTFMVKAAQMDQKLSPPSFSICICLWPHTSSEEGGSYISALFCSLQPENEALHRKTSCFIFFSFHIGARVYKPHFFQDVIQPDMMHYYLSNMTLTYTIYLHNMLTCYNELIYMAYRGHGAWLSQDSLLL